jgi:uncharacterized protein (TIGR02246 family)
MIACLLSLALLATGTADSEPPTSIVARMWTDYIQLTTHHDADALANLFTIDARLMEAGADDVVGRATIRALMKTAFEQRVRVIDLRVIPREIVAYEGVIYDQGDSIETVAPQSQPSQAVDRYGRYFAIWVAQADGSWKLARLYVSPKLQPRR